MARRLTGASFCTAGATVTGTGAESFVRSAAPPPHEQVERAPRPSRKGASMRGGRAGRIPTELSLRLQGLLGRLYREWFPPTWRRNPTYAEVVGDFRWWLGVAERWSEPPVKNGRPRRAAREPRADQPKRLLRLLGLRHECTASEFMARWRRFLKAHHPDLNPDQTPDERRDFAEAVALWRR